MKTKFIAGVAIMALVGAAFAGGEGWSHDYAAAQKQAAESKKDLLLDFTGSDWCVFCKALNEEVFEKDRFKVGVKDAFVLVELDFPRDKSKLSEETQKQNRELQRKYAVSGFPKIVLCDAEGRPYAATGYQEDGAEKYVEHLNGLRGNKAKRDEALATAAKSEGVAKAKALIAALDAMNLEDNVVAQFYGDFAGQIKAADPKDETGFAKRAASEENLAKFQGEIKELASKKDMDGQLALIDKTLKDGNLEPSENLHVMMARAMVYMQAKKFDEAIKAVDAAKGVVPDSPLMPNIEKFRENLVKSQQKAAEKK